MNFDGLIFYLVGSWIFVLVLSAAELMFSLNYRRKPAFARKYALCLLGSLAVSVPLTLAYYAVDKLIALPIVTNVAVVAVYLAMFGLSLLGLSFCYDEKFRSYLICGIAGYATQHIFYNIYGLINLDGAFELLFYKLGRYPGLAYSSLVQLAVAGAVLAAVYFLFARRANRNAPDGLLGKNVAPISVAALSIVLVLNAVRNIYSRESAVLNVLCGIFLIVCCVFILILRMGLLERNRLNRNIDMMTKLHREQLKHYEHLKENMELVNIKCHDIKHYIESAEKKNGIDFEDLKKLVTIYDSDVKTGNETVDTILAERSLYCCAHGIKMTVLADAAGLNFMEVADLCSLFGNAVENAIEAVGKIADESKRVIDVSVRQVAGHIDIRVENYCAEIPEFAGGMPISDKNDPDYHGFGVKSIRMVTEKYDGTFTCAVDGNYFRLNILLPLPENKKGL